ncbi:putative metallophosphoesterase YhaO [Polystyrenella longa]|uniref:Putative metallophosphoesterase YhaO n=1 Tax=Polystyrenella longa TaxID=2528007 RepID=A0A518CJ28_9PLAN|nr:hypothetical protein [Polystyrenella longa]QDU79235.1 putative metallophosphoesterase YhaO [Polystyrenella longa]
MPQSPLRFLHADQLNLDVPFEGIGTLSADTLREFSTASLALLNNMLEWATEESLPFVLLTGPLFGADPPSLAAQSALRNFAAELYELGVELVLCPHALERDLLPRDYWNDLDAILLENDKPATIELESTNAKSDARMKIHLQVAQENNLDRTFTSPPAGTDFSLCVLEAGTPFASLQTLLEQSSGNAPIPVEDCEAQLQETIESIRRTVTADYVALSGYGYRADAGNDVSQTNAVYHSPGGLMPRTFEEASVPTNGQATLVSIHQDHSLQFVPKRLAPVRLLPLEVDVNHYSDENELLRHMQQALDQYESVAAEKRLVVQWRLRGDSSLLFELAEPEHRQELANRIKGSKPLLQIWRVQFNRELLSRNQPEESLAIQYLEQLELFAETNRSELVADFLTRTKEHPQLQHRLRQLGAEVSNESILTAATLQGAPFLLDLDQEDPR